MAEISEATKAYTAAAIWYIDIASRHFGIHGTTRAAEALYRAGEAFEKCDEIDRALGCYQKILSEYSSNPIANLAASKISALGRKKNTNTIGAAVKTASQPIAASTPTREFNPTDSVTAAQWYNCALSYETSNQGLALNYYNSIIGLYALTQYADMACERICALVGGEHPPGNPYSVADLTRSDLLMSKASAYERTGNTVSAINLYRTVINTYPNSGDAYSAKNRLIALTGTCAK